MLANEIKLGPAGSETVLSAFGREFSEGLVEISREDRTASGRLVRDVVVTKKKFTIKYDLISHTDLTVIAGYYDLQTTLSLIVARPDYTTNTYTVLLKPFDRTRARSVAFDYWSGVTLELEQV